MAADEYIKVEGFNAAGPGSVVVVTIEDRLASVAAAAAAEISKAAAEFSATAAATSATASATAAAAAAAARDEAVAAAQSVTDSTDGQIAGLVADAGSETRIALDSRYGGGGGGGTGIVGAPAEWPQFFPPLDHTHPVSQIGATDVGKAVMSAATMAAARLAIGAGTGNGTSNLAIGTTGTTAAAGNHAHAASAITFNPAGTGLVATTVQAAIIEAAASGGGGSSLASALPGTLIIIDKGAGWPTTRPSARTDLHFALVASTAVSDVPSWMTDKDYRWVQGV